MDAEERQAMQYVVNAAFAQVRWRAMQRQSTGDATRPYATHEGILTLPHLGALKVYRLNTGERVFDAEDVARLLGLED